MVGRGTLLRSPPGIVLGGALPRPAATPTTAPLALPAPLACRGDRGGCGCIATRKPGAAVLSIPMTHESRRAPSMRLVLIILLTVLALSFFVLFFPIIVIVIGWFRRPSEPPETLDQSVVERWKRDRSWDAKFTLFTYYKFLREKVRREDDLTNQRTTWSMQFQGFLVAAMALLLSSSKWTGGMTAGIEFLRLLTFPAIGLMGLSLACMTRAGVAASRDAIIKVKSYWQCYVDRDLQIVPSRAPRTYGRWQQHQIGTRYVLWIPTMFLLFWSVYLSALLRDCVERSFCDAIEH
jgi:hypothetical protein